jgi:hypothetical protein
MPKRTYYAINANSGAYVDIPCTISCRKMVISECRKSDGSAYAPQTLAAKYQQPNGTYPAAPDYSVPGDDIVIGHPAMEGNGMSPLLGLPVQNAANGVGAWNYRAADVPIKLLSGTATATQVEVTEYE